MSNDGISPEEEKVIENQINEEMESEIDLDSIDNEIEKEAIEEENFILNRLESLSKEHDIDISRLWYIELVVPIKREKEVLKALFFKRPTRKDVKYFQKFAQKTNEQAAEDNWIKTMCFDNLTSAELDDLDGEAYSKIIKKLMSFTGVTLQDILQAR